MPEIQVDSPVFPNAFVGAGRIHEGIHHMVGVHQRNMAGRLIVFLISESADHKTQGSLFAQIIIYSQLKVGLGVDKFHGRKLAEYGIERFTVWIGIEILSVDR